MASDLAKKYTADHEWVQVVDDNRVRVGITDYAQRSLGDLVYVELPTMGSVLGKGDMMGVVESVKGASDIYAPVSGKITKINDQTSLKPVIINKSAEQDGKHRTQLFKQINVGWLCEMELNENNELDALYDEEGYVSFCKGQN